MSTGAIVIACIIAGVPLIFGFIMYVSTAETATGKATMAVFLISTALVWFVGGYKYAMFEIFFQHPLGDTLSPLSFIPSACIAALPTMICYAICKNIEDAKAEKKDK